MPTKNIQNLVGSSKSWSVNSSTPAVTISPSATRTTTTPSTRKTVRAPDWLRNPGPDGGVALLMDGPRFCGVRVRVTE